VTNHIHRSTTVQEQNEQLGVKFPYSKHIYNWAENLLFYLQKGTATCFLLAVGSIYVWRSSIHCRRSLIQDPSILSLQCQYQYQLVSQTDQQHWSKPFTLSQLCDLCLLWESLLEQYNTGLSIRLNSVS
jgi:hypothetical protein